MKTKLTALFLALALLIGVMPVSRAAETGSMDNFVKTRTYTEGTFADIKGYWAEATIKRAYEYGIINGKGDGKFDPGGTMTGAEAVKIAAMIHAAYKYGGDPDALIDSRNYDTGSAWWNKYRLYCEEEIESVKTWLKLAGTSGDSHMNSAVKRKDMALMWSGILDEKDMETQNTFNGALDVKQDALGDERYAAISLFYSAGIVNGTDEWYSFQPEANINRAAAAVIFMRLADKSERISGGEYKSLNAELLADMEKYNGDIVIVNKSKFANNPAPKAEPVDLSEFYISGAILASVIKSARVVYNEKDNNYYCYFSVPKMPAGYGVIPNFEIFYSTSNFPYYSNLLTSAMSDNRGKDNTRYYFTEGSYCIVLEVVFGDKPQVPPDKVWELRIKASLDYLYEPPLEYLYESTPKYPNSTNSNFMELDIEYPKTDKQHISGIDDEYVDAVYKEVPNILSLWK